MAMPATTMNEVFLDDSYAVALSSVTDAHHQKALTGALTADEHYKQAGFRALLLVRG